MIPEITDYNYMGSTVGNALFSGVSLAELWICITREELDAAVSAVIRLKELGGSK